ncbi:MAG: hypothetical protein ACTSPD_04505 [Promethearchaeota archaeon]
MTSINNENLEESCIFYLKRCSFFIDTNNLIDIAIVETILDEFQDDAIKRLNKIINGIKFFVGGLRTKSKECGILRFTTYELNLHDRTINFFLSKIFNLGFESWKSLSLGALKRYIWESFFHEFIMGIIHVLKINLSLIEVAKNYCFDNDTNKRIKRILYRLFNNQDKDIPRINYIAMHTKLWRVTLPKLGFFELLYNAKIKDLKHINSKNVPIISKVRILNELRKIKMNYEYEYNLSELINYVIDKDHFKIYFKHNWKNRKELFYKAKREILKFIKLHDIPFKIYLDSANRKHYFLTHNIFERIKSACYQICLVKISNKMLREFEVFKKFYSKCPICKNENLNQKKCELFYFSPKFSYFKDILIEKMKEVDSIDKLNDDEYFFGIPCDDCYHITNNIQGRFIDLNEIQKFIIAYNKCPICSAKNHINYLTSFYNDNSKRNLRDFLIRSMEVIKNKNYNINIGIPCCICYEQYFGEKPENYNI